MVTARIISADPEGLGKLWVAVQLPHDTAELWAREGLDAVSAERAITAFDAETVRAWMEGGHLPA